MELVEIYNFDWAKISSKLNKPKSLVMKRYKKRLDPKLKFSKFTNEEDSLIINLYKIYGGTWNFIAKFLPNRNSMMIKNRFYSTLKKRIFPIKDLNLDEQTEIKASITNNKCNTNSEKKEKYFENEKITWSGINELNVKLTNTYDSDKKEKSNVVDKNSLENLDFLKDKFLPAEIEIEVNSPKEKRKTINDGQIQEEWKVSEKNLRKTVKRKNKDIDNKLIDGIHRDSKSKLINELNNLRLNDTYKEKGIEIESIKFDEVKNDNLEKHSLKNSISLNILETLSDIYLNKEGKNIRNRKESMNEMVFNEKEKLSGKSSFFSFLEELNIEKDKNLKENEEIKIFSNLSNHKNTLDFEEDNSKIYEKIETDFYRDNQTNNCLIFNNLFDNFFQNKKCQEIVKNSLMNSYIVSANELAQKIIEINIHKTLIENNFKKFQTILMSIPKDEEYMKFQNFFLKKIEFLVDLVRDLKTKIENLCK